MLIFQGVSLSLFASFYINAFIGPALRKRFLSQVSLVNTPGPTFFRWIFATATKSHKNHTNFQNKSQKQMHVRKETHQFPTFLTSIDFPTCLTSIDHLNVGLCLRGKFSPQMLNASKDSPWFFPTGVNEFPNGCVMCFSRVMCFCARKIIKPAFYRGKFVPTSTG